MTEVSARKSGWVVIPSMDWAQPEAATRLGWDWRRGIVRSVPIRHLHGDVD